MNDSAIPNIMPAPGLRKGGGYAIEAMFRVLDIKEFPDHNADHKPAQFVYIEVDGKRPQWVRRAALDEIMKAMKL